MRIPSHARTVDSGCNMTPMIDVVFLLIIFFLVSSHLAKQEAQMELPLPEAASGSPPLDQAKRVTLNVLRDGELILAGHRVGPDELVAKLAGALQRNAGDLEVRIRGDRGVSYRHVEPVMLACAEAGIWNVTFGVFQREME